MSVKDTYRLLLNISTKVLGIHTTKILDARFRFGRKINLNNPTSLADKLCYMELHDDNPLKVSCSDKYAVREYVTKKGLADILVPLCHDVCTNAEQIQYHKLPQQFAIKAAHGCGMNLICEDKDNISQEQLMDTAKKWLDMDYPRACIEPHYKKIPHRILFEEFLQDADRIIDYKFFCFHGVPDFVEVCSNRRSGIKLDVYTLDWAPLDAVVGKKKGNHGVPQPDSLSDMIEICKILSADFNFVRVDLYEINKKVYFGELTFSPAAGVLPNFHEDFLKEKGTRLHFNT